MNSALETLLRTVVSSNLFLQLFPYIVLFAFPVLLVTATTCVRRTINAPAISMGLDSLGFSAPWTWFSNGRADPRPVHSHHHHQSNRKSKKLKKAVVIKKGAVILRSFSSGYLTFCVEEDVGDGYYPGLVNISGTYCFMNSTIQVFPWASSIGLK